MKRGRPNLGVGHGVASKSRSWLRALPKDYTPLYQVQCFSKAVACRGAAPCIHLGSLQTVGIQSQIVLNNKYGWDLNRWSRVKQGDRRCRVFQQRWFRVEVLSLVGMLLNDLWHPISQQTRWIEISYSKLLLTCPKKASIDEQTINANVQNMVFFWECSLLLIETLCGCR